MVNRRFPWVELVTTLALMALVVAVFWKLFPCLKSEVAAAWVQAIGSMAAIIGAFMIGERQARSTREGSLELDRISVQRKNRAILAIADSARAHARSISAVFTGDDDNINMLAVMLVYNRKTLSGVIDALAAIPLHDLGSYEAVDSLLKIKEASTLLLEKVERFMQAPQAPELAEVVGAPPLRVVNMAERKVSIRTSCIVVEQQYQRFAAALAA